MIRAYDFESQRLGFRQWTDKDKDPFSKMNKDPDVMAFMPKRLSEEESNAFITRIQTHFDNHGFGLWAVEIKETNSFIGFIGFYTATFVSDFTPCIEIGWRLDKIHWYKGYATEGALACLKFGKENLGLEEVYSFTSKINTQSINVMQKIGLKQLKVFNHPNIGEGNPLKEHVLYYKDLNES